MHFENSNGNTITYSSYTTINTHLTANDVTVNRSLNGGGVGIFTILLGILTAPIWIPMMLLGGRK